MTNVTFILPTLNFCVWLLGTLTVASVIHACVQRAVLGKRCN